MSSFEQLQQRLRNRVPRLVEPKSVESGSVRVIIYPGDPRHPVRERAMPGPTSLVLRDGRFEPEHGFERFFEETYE